MRVTQLAPAAAQHPPQATSPSWVWPYLLLGRGGRVQRRGRLDPDVERTSTDVRPLPPVIKITETRHYKYKDTDCIHLHEINPIVNLNYLITIT